MLAAPRVVDEIKKVKLPFSVGTFQQAAGEVILENSEFIQKNIKNLLRERDRVLTSLDSFPGISPVPSTANFILFRSTRHPAAKIYSGLYREGVLIRSYQNPELADMLRVTIGTEVEKLRNVILEIES
jgi:histidinol-phosphate aminotransferase